MEKYNYAVTPRIRDFIIRNTELNLIPKNNIIGYNHVMERGVSKRNISSDVAYYLLLSDLNSIVKKINEYLKVDLSESKLCALISYYHSLNSKPYELSFTTLNSGKYILFGEELFLNKSNRELRSLRSLEYTLWNSDSGIHLGSKVFKI